MPRTLLMLVSLEGRDCPAITIQFDYTYDTNGFFSDAAKAALQRAADAIDSRLETSLTAIVPDASESHTWTISAFDAVTNSDISVANPTIPANTIVIYVAGGPVGGTELGEASTGGYTTGNFPAGDSWPDTIKGRGQAGALAATPTAYSPWGGFIAFDSTANWNFTASAPSSSQYDFASVASHEILHVLGFGTTTAYSRWISNGTFTGPNAEASYGGPVPVYGSDGGHWAPSVVSGGQTAVMVPSIPNGVARIVTPVDWAAIEDIGWQVSPAVPPPPPPPPAVDSGPVKLIVGSGVGHTPLVAGLNATGGTVWNDVPFDESFTGGVRVASGDFNGDGVLDAVVGTGPGVTAEVKVIDGATRKTLFDITPFADFTGGVFVAAGDITGDGIADLVISPDEGGGPRVRIFNGRNFTEISDFYGINDPNFRGGARVAVGDINGDGHADLVVAAGVGGGPRISTYDGAKLTITGGPNLFGDFFAFESTLRNGTFVAVSDMDGDGKADLIVGAGPGGGPRVSVFSGAALLNNQYTRIIDFFAGDTSSRDGIHVAAFTPAAGSKPDLVTGSGQGFGSELTAYTAASLLANPAASPVWNENYFGDTGGIYVG